MPPAARITDMHVCPKVEPGPVPHVGGPISSGEATVLIGFMPAARVSDSAVCIGPPDSISQGESTVIIGNKHAARLGDPTSHGGVIVAGCPTVIIGSSAQGQTIVVAAQNGVPFCEECAKKQAKAAAEAQAQAQSTQPPPEAPALSASTALGAVAVPASSSKPKGGANPNTKRAASRGSTLHSDKPGHLPEQLRERYPDTQFEFTKPGKAGQDVKVAGGKHPSDYEGSNWKPAVDHGDFKPDTDSGRNTFKSDQKNKWKEETQMLPYDPKTGKLK